MARTEADRLISVCRAVALVLPPDAVFTHLTGARLRGWWLPHLDDEPLIACTDGEAPHHDRRGVYVRRCQIPPGHRRRHHGVQVASPEWTIVEIAEHLSLVDLIVAIDSALHAGDTTVAAIRATMRRGRRGVRALRHALDLVDARSQSPWETVLRLTHTFAGIATIPQSELRDEVGNPIWSLDLRLVGTNRAVEFDGGVHRERDVHVRDLRRDGSFATPRTPWAFRTSPRGCIAG